jgi:hypothetical protein
MMPLTVKIIGHKYWRIPEARPYRFRDSAHPIVAVFHIYIFLLSDLPAIIFAVKFTPLPIIMPGFLSKNLFQSNQSVIFTVYKAELKDEQTEKGAGPLQSVSELQDKFNFYEMNRKTPLTILLI